MPFSKFIAIPVLLGVQAALLILLAPYIPGASPEVGGAGPEKTGLLIFVSFQAWAVYFAAGCTPKDGVKVVLSYLAGILVSIGIILLAGLMPSSLGVFAFAIAVFVLVIPAISLERVPMFDFIPGLFIGSGMFFAIWTLGGPLDVNESGEAVRLGFQPTTADFMSIAVPEMIGCIVGQIFGFITVTWRGAYEAAVGKKEEE